MVRARGERARPGAVVIILIHPLTFCPKNFLDNPYRTAVNIGA
jgi:hypothetical protein